MEREGAVVTIFRSRLRPGVDDEYGPLADRMLVLARATAGFVEFKSFTADDGERVSIVVFASPEAQKAWRDHPEHRRARVLGRSRLYESYRVQVCRIEREAGMG